MRNNRAGFTALILLFAILVIPLQSITQTKGQSSPSETGGLTATNDVTPAPPTQLNTPQKIETARQTGKISQDQAALYMAYALIDSQKLPGEYHSQLPWDGTLPLLKLRRSLITDKLRPQTATTISALLSTICYTSSTALPNSTSSSHYYIEYGSVGGGLTLTDYIASLETAWKTEVTEFGWAAPPVKLSNPPPGNKYHVRIAPLGSGLYGYVSSQGTFAGLVQDNPNTSWDDGDAYASCMVLNNDYSTFLGTSQAALDATTAHEFNHAIQYGLGALDYFGGPDPIFIEGGATWMEDEVFDSANDNYHYLWPQFNVCMGEYLYSPYPYWITFRGMLERFGAGIPGGSEDVMQKFWELTSQNVANNLDAMNQALVSRGTSLAAAFHYYAIAVRFKRACGGGYAYPYCLEEGPAYPALPLLANSSINHGNIISIHGSYSGDIPDNYALNWIGLPVSGSPYTVTLSNNATGGQLRGSVVCDTGAALSVHPFPEVVGAGQATRLEDFDPTGCNSIVLVLTNQAQTAANPASCDLRNYQVLTTGATTNGTPTPTAPASTYPYRYFFLFVEKN